MNLLNLCSIVLLLCVCLFFVSSERMNDATNDAHMARYELSINANRFMNASGYLTDGVRAYAATGNQIHYDNYWNEINNLKN